MSIYGSVRLIADLRLLEHQVNIIDNIGGIDYVVVCNYLISVGQFSDRVIDLAIPTPKEYPRAIGSSIHIKSNPHLLDYNDTIPRKRNIIESPLGEKWRYWSFRFQINPENPTKDLMSQINGIFRNI